MRALRTGVIIPQYHQESPKRRLESLTCARIDRPPCASAGSWYCRTIAHGSKSNRQDLQIEAG